MAGLPIFDTEIKANTGIAIFDPGIFDGELRTLPSSPSFASGTTLVSRRRNIFNKQDVLVRSATYPK